MILQQETGTMTSQLPSRSVGATSYSPSPSQAHLELLSNTAVLTKVLEERKRESSVTSVSSATAITSSAATTPTPPAASNELGVIKPVAEEKALLSPANLQSPRGVAMTSGQTTPASFAPSSIPSLHHTPGSPPKTVLLPAGGAAALLGTSPRLRPSCSYASLLVPTPGQTAAPGRFSSAVTMATVMGMYGSCSAFSKPNMFANGAAAPGAQIPVTVTASPSMEELRDAASEMTGDQKGKGTHASVALQAAQASSYESLLQETIRLRQNVQEKDERIAELESKVDVLENQVVELRQLPTGKISHIPIEDMLRIMEEYGSEVSNQTLPKRKHSIQKASIVRQFRRWNPEFFRYFTHSGGKWVPRLGKAGELKRRAEKRLALSHMKNGKSTTSKASAQPDLTSSITAN